MFKEEGVTSFLILSIINMCVSFSKMIEEIIVNAYYIARFISSAKVSIAMLTLVFEFLLKPCLLLTLVC